MCLKYHGLITGRHPRRQLKCFKPSVLVVSETAAGRISFEHLNSYLGFQCFVYSFNKPQKHPLIDGLAKSTNGVLNLY